MYNSFYRKVGFGIGINDKIPADPLKWATDQLDEIPELLWTGWIPSEKEMRIKYGEWIYGDRKVLRKKYKNDKNAYRKAKDKLSIQTGERFFELNEHAIRHYQTKYSNQPVFERFWLFWGNHFAISEKDSLADFSTGPYQREIIRPNMIKTFEDMVQEVTRSWCMIHHLDNSESVGPNSKRGIESRDTINENHARELLELHTVSPEAGYTQDDVINLAYIMTGWGHKWNNKVLETGDVWFDQDKHQKGEKIVLGKKYKNEGKRELSKVIHDLSNHPQCIKFVSTKLCRHFITDNPTKDMVDPVIKAWTNSNGNLIKIHKAVIQQAYKNNNFTYKFQLPEVWIMQLSRIFDLNLPISSKKMNYEFKFEPSNRQEQLTWYLNEVGHSPYRPKQPNGWSDYEVDWISPELLLRRLWFASNEIPNHVKIENYSHSFMSLCLERNFDNHERMTSMIEDLKINKITKNDLEKIYGIICNLPWVLKA
jgi:uncharacterized protein (DUF1800 family)|tara:strand:+ start:1142 stop:2581 length:1440 start_codon:yes stop_codon:yes gene_type:complete